MSFEIRYDRLPAGFVVDVPTPDKVLVCSRGFTSSEDGDDFIRCLESLSDMVISRLPGGVGAYESMIDHLVAVIRSDKTATVYINELAVMVKCQLKDEAPGIGEAVYHDQFADVTAVRLGNIAVPPDAGIMVVLSSKWRKGFYYDLEPLLPQRGEPRDYDLERLLGQVWTYLSFQNRVNISDSQWSELLTQAWFPFVGLSAEIVRKMCFLASKCKPIDELVKDIEGETRALIPKLRARIAKSLYFTPHQSTLSKAFDHFENGDYLSCTALLYPRIEGVMRSYHATVGPAEKATQRNLVGVATGDTQATRNALSLLLPSRFRVFLEKVYFATFDPANVTIVSRNSVAHGVAPESAMSMKSALLGILLLDQLSLLMYRPAGEGAS